MPTAKSSARLVPLLLCACLGGCLVGPNYKRPSVVTPPVYKEAEGWTPANPSDAADRQDWWTVFGDPVLNDLEVRVQVSNQTLVADEAAYRVAHALVAQNRAALFPTATLNGSATAMGGGANSSTGGSTVANFSPTVGATWAPDIWGAVRRTIENAKDNAQASYATLVNARLSAQVTLAIDYISLRQLDEEKRIYDATVQAYARTLAITQNKYKVGVAAQSDVLTAQTQLESAQATDTDLGQQRPRLEHAIAVLAGEPPAAMTLAPEPWNLKLPQIPAAVPSVLLQRRPDVAGAERTAAGANALIGQQLAAYYPNITLSGEGGFSASNLGSLFNVSNSFWSVGASAAETVFDAGARRAKVQGARANYDEAVANYRQSVLTAFAQVEDNLAAQQVYAVEEAQDAKAAADALKNVTITLNEYKAGTVDFTTVATAQTTALSAENTLLGVQSSRLATAVNLIEALGGGWNASLLPKD